MSNRSSLDITYSSLFIENNLVDTVTAKRARQTIKETFMPDDLSSYDNQTLYHREIIYLLIYCFREKFKLHKIYIY